MPPKLADELIPVRELDPEYRKKLINKGSALNLNAGDRISGTDVHRWLLYLLSGKLTLYSDKDTTVIAAHTERALYPIFSDTIPKEQLAALYPCRILKLDRNMYETLRQEQSQAGYEIQEIELDDNETELFDSVYHAYTKKQLKLPSLPEIAVKIRILSNDPNIDSGRLARVVQTDPGTAGILLHAANSAMYTGSSPVVNIRDAIVRLGLEKTRHLVFSTAMHHVFKSKSALFKDYMHELWDRSVRISALSHVIAGHCKGLDPDRAMLAGLICDVGELPILHYLAERQESPDEYELQQIIHKLRSVVGEMITDFWGLDASLTTVVRESRNWQRQTDNGKADYCDVVLLARLYLHAEKEDIPAYETIPAFTRISKVFTDLSFHPNILDEAQVAFEAIIATLKQPKRQTAPDTAQEGDMTQTDRQELPDIRGSLAMRLIKPQAEIPAAPVVKECEPILPESTPSSKRKEPVIGTDAKQLDELALQETSPARLPPNMLMDQGMRLQPDWFGAWPMLVSSLFGSLVAIGALALQPLLASWFEALQLSPTLAQIPIIIGLIWMSASLLGFIIRRYTRSYRITPQGIEIKHGLFFKNTKQLPLHQIRGIGINQSAVQRMFGIGNLEFDGGNFTDLIFADIGRPTRIRQRIQNYIKARQSLMQQDHNIQHSINSQN